MEFCGIIVNKCRCQYDNVCQLIPNGIKFLKTMPYEDLTKKVYPYNIYQSSNAMRKGPEFYTTNCCRAVYVGKIAQLILNNLNSTEIMLSGAWFCKLLSDWSKTLFGSQDLVSGHKVKMSVLTHTPTLGQ